MVMFKSIIGISFGNRFSNIPTRICNHSFQQTMKLTRKQYILYVPSQALPSVMRPVGEETP